MTNSEPAKTRALRVMCAIVRFRLARELLIVFAFTSLTAIMTWPYVTRLRDAVAGPGDPYLITWTLWWDYHQTFTNPLNLFHANVFYPYRYTLAFTEHCYGLALLCFPLFALGLKPLTVHAVAMFFGFALSGYGAFRLARTTTGSYGVAWVAGVLFAFVPYRFTMMAQLMYLFSPWIPLLFEALFLFIRERSWGHAVWFGVTFFMIGLTTVSWLLFSLIPLALAGAVLLTRYQLWRDRQLWRRAIVSLGVASIAMLPFLFPYYIVSRLYGFQRSVDDVISHSAMPYHWLVAEGRNKLWAGLGEKFPEAWKFQMFPGLLALLLPLGEVFLIEPQQVGERKDRGDRSKWIKRLDIAATVLLVLSILALGFDETNAFSGLFLNHIRSERTLMLLTVVVIARFCFAYPNFLRHGRANLIETINSPRRSEAFWFGVILAVVGFFYSIGWHSFFYRFLYSFMPGFKSIRAPMRGAMFACLGLALLSGLGAKRIRELVSQRWARVHPAAIYGMICLLLLLELNGAPLVFMRGEVFPDAVTLRLKSTQMRGGIAYLPAGVDFNQRYMLRAADHMKPLILGTSGFTPPIEDQIESMTQKGAIKSEFMDLLETIPASYLVVCNQSITPERAEDYQAFLIKSLSQGRLRFINRFDGRDDLYAIVKTEPGAQTEGPLPLKLVLNYSAKRLDNTTKLPIAFANSIEYR